MRLLDTANHKLTEFQSRIPPYAILSHVWGEEEVTFHAIADLDGAKKMQGFAKIAGACNTAAKDGFQYIWIDTCCINKESSAELSEAINSMYNWYRDASVCYAYLADVSSEGNCEYPSALFAMSRWFSRGWTLQELIAPSQVIFYEASWIDIGTKSSMKETISTMTGISAGVIVGSIALDNIPVAVRMSWAAGRSTTREEDIAYSLMGLFGINMPLLYGEGRKAFIRLQHEIIKTSDDHSIFAWSTPPPEGSLAVFRRDELYRGILARSPKEFHASSNVERIITGSQSKISEKVPHTTPYSLTNQGLYIELPTLQDEYSTLAFLNCYLSGTAEPLVIRLEHQGDLNTYARIGADSLDGGDEPYEIPRKRSSLYIVDDYNSDDASTTDLHDRHITVNTTVPNLYGKPHIVPIDCESTGNGQWSSRQRPPVPGGLVFIGPSNERFAVVFGYRQQGGVWCDLLLGTNREDLYGWLYLERRQACLEGRELQFTRDLGWLEGRQFRDRVSGDLARRWSVTASSRTISPYKARIDIEITNSQIPRILPKCPDRHTACVIVPPARKHKFKVYPGKSKQYCTMVDVFEISGVFILYMDDPQGIGSLVFKRGDGDEGEEFVLLVRATGKSGFGSEFLFTLTSSEGIKGVPDASEKSVCSIRNQGGRETKVSATIKPLIYEGLGDCIISISVLP